MLTFYCKITNHMTQEIWYDSLFLFLFFGLLVFSIAIFYIHEEERSIKLSTVTFCWSFKAKEFGTIVFFCFCLVFVCLFFQRWAAKYFILDFQFDFSVGAQPPTTPTRCTHKPLNHRTTTATSDVWMCFQSFLLVVFVLLIKNNNYNINNNNNVESQLFRSLWQPRSLCCALWAPPDWTFTGYFPVFSYKCPHIFLRRSLFLHFRRCCLFFSF